MCIILKEHSTNKEIVMNRFSHSQYRSFALCSFFAVALAIVGMVAGVGQAQLVVPKKTAPAQQPVQKKSTASGVMAKPMEHAGQYTLADLAVTSFAGAFEGKYIVLDVQIKNLGPAEYGGGRYVIIYAEYDGGGGIPLTSVLIDPLRPGQTWPCPTFKFERNKLPRKAPPTTRFRVQLSGNDGNQKNEATETTVTLDRLRRPTGEIKPKTPAPQPLPRPNGMVQPWAATPLPTKSLQK